MSADSPAKTMTSDELFALPFNKKWQRYLFRGELRTRRMTKRNPNHAFTTATLSTLLNVWLWQQPKPRGMVYDGEAYFRIRKDPDTNVGIDVALASAELAARTGKKSKYLDGPPLLAVEVISPSDKARELDEAVAEYLECGVQVVWLIDPMDETVTVYRPGRPPELVNNAQELSGEPELPGFRVRVATIFE